MCSLQADRTIAISTPIAEAADFVELCELYGYYAEEHIVQTKDGYLLGLHRLGWRKGEEDQRVNSGEGSLKKKVAYLHHGLMMNSEVWVCLTEKERCLPFVLVEQGFDVWVGQSCLLQALTELTSSSSATIEATNILRRASITPRHLLISGTTLLISLHSMISRTVSITSCRRRGSPRFRILDSPKELPRPLPHYLSIPT